MLVDFRAPDSGNDWMWQVQVLVIVDSGTGVTMLPKRFAAPLRIDLAQLGLRTVLGPDDKRIPCYNKVWLEALLCGEWIRLPVLFFAGDEKHALLGRAGAFDALKLAFIQSQRIMYGALDR
jgi:hypothetical protein